MEYFIEKKLPQQIKKLYQSGGQYQKAAEKVKQIIGDINLNSPDPLKDVPKTHNGESRIKNCVKYDLSGYARLITIQHEGVCTLIYLGNHEECEKYLEGHKGLNLAFDKKDRTLVEVIVTDDINDPDKRQSSDSDYSDGKLHKKLKDHYFFKITKGLDYQHIQPFLEFESDVTDYELLEACEAIEAKNLQTVFLDVFESLKKGDVEAARNRISFYEAELKLLEDATKEEKEQLVSNDQFVRLNELEAEFIKGILETKDWFDWMLFLHPTQKEVVQADFTGSSRLLGVSGSGKTCVLVHRAVRLAKKYPGEKVLILTLNPALAKLIKQLINILLDNTQQPYLSDQINVSSFWEVCRDLLIRYDENKFKERIFNARTDGHGETIDEVWEEYYKCHLNNHDADVLFPVHQTLLVREIHPLDYLKQEFDWIRSAFSYENRESYLNTEREGRKIPFVENYRKAILEGLKGWDKKMEDVGAVDYLGLANRLVKFIGQIEPTYRCVLVDEVQDFGTLELKLIRKMVTERENDLFLTGDIAQQVYNKQHKIRVAGINIPANGYVKILKNYRNSREILEAAYSVFKSNIHDEDFKSEDFELLKPEYANFSSPKPFLREAETIEDEFFFAISYLQEILTDSQKEKGCIALCGYSMFEVGEIATKIGLSILDGLMDLSEGNIFLSDLEQTKGFEFDRMIILNCKSGVFPNPRLPKEEWFREVSKLYVAMTRAKKDLVISYHGKVSGLFEGQDELFTKDIWSTHVSQDVEVKFNLPDRVKEGRSIQSNGSMSGKEFLYTHRAVGVSNELQIKLLELVAGNSVFDEKGRQIGWKNMQELSNYLGSRKRDNPTLTRIFGPVVFMELENLLKN